MCFKLRYWSIVYEFTRSWKRSGLFLSKFQQIAIFIPFDIMHSNGIHLCRHASIHEKPWFLMILPRKFEKIEYTQCLSCSFVGTMTTKRQTSMVLSVHTYRKIDFFRPLWQVVFLNGHRPTDQLTNQWFMIVWHCGVLWFPQTGWQPSSYGQSETFCETILFFKMSLCLFALPSFSLSQCRCVDGCW